MKACPAEGGHATDRLVKGLCLVHYMRLRRHGSTELQRRLPRVRECAACHEVKFIKGRGLCARDYTRSRRPVPPPPRVCRVCGRKHYAHGLCYLHYREARRKPPRVRPTGCMAVGCEGKHKALGLCQRHYNLVTRTRKPLPRPELDPCTQCGAEGTAGSRSGLCKACYQTWYNRTRRGRGVPKPVVAPEPKVLVGEWIERDGVTVVHWPKGVECPICGAGSVVAA